MAEANRVGDLKAAPYNPRKIKAAQLEALGKALREFWDLGGVVVNTRTGNLVGGHQRVKHLDSKWRIVKSKRDGIAGTVARGYIVTPFGEMDYREVDWDENKEKAANLAANKHGGEFDLNAVGLLLADLSAANFDLDLTGFLEADRLSMFPDLNGGVVEDEVHEPPAEATTRRGDIITLGRHRLLCGDSTKEGDWKRLMSGQAKADVMWTDPPYGVSYVGKTKKKLQIENDGVKGLPELLQSAFSNISAFALSEGAAIYVAHPAGVLSVVFDNAFVAQGWRLHETLIWLKNSMVLGHSDYHFKHEPITFGYKQGGGRRGRGAKGWYGPNNETSVLAFDRPSRSEQHPTMKPVGLVAHCLKNSCPTKGVVVDPFLGSGTTLIAAEQTGRACFGMELDPRYFDVITKRWETISGGKVTRKNNL